MTPQSPTAETSTLVMRGISKRFGATIALDDVSLEVRAGEVHALVGENGAGKSTLMKILSGALQPDAGEILLDGRRFLPRHPHEARLQGIGMIYQELALAPHLTAMENIILGTEPSTLGFVRWREVRQQAVRVLQQFDHPELRPESRVRDLPPSAQQLVEIGRSLASGCRVLVFDEPTSSLTQRDIERLFEIIRSLKQNGATIVYISHFLEEIQQIADRVTVLRDGRKMATYQAAAVSAAEIVRAMVGREIRELYPRSARQRGEMVLEISDLAGVTKPESASLQLYRGEVLGICGLMGAGRTELLRAIFGLDPVGNGRIKLSTFLGPASPYRRWLQGAGMLSENRKEEGLALNLSLADNVTLTRLRGLGPWRIVLPARQSAASQRWIERLEIRCESPNQRVNQLSGGNQQKLALARLLHHEVDVLLLDEPTRGIDVAAKAKIYQVIDALASGTAEPGKPPKAVLMVSSYLPELLGICDRIAVMYRGRLGAAMPVAMLDEHQLMLAATGQSSLQDEH